MPEDALRMLEKKSRRVRYSAGTRMTRRSGDTETLYLVYNGELEWRDAAAPPKRLRAGSLFASGTEDPNILSVTTTADAEIIEMPRSLISEIMEAWPQVRNELPKTLMDMRRPIVE